MLRHLQDTDERAAMLRILDLAEKVLTKHEIASTDFLDPHYTSLAEAILKGLPDLKFSLQGGYGEPERQRIVLFPDYMEQETIESKIKLLKITGSKGFNDLKHRDFLGSLLGLGIRREKVGDILVGEEFCLVAMAAEMTAYVAANLLKVGSVPVDVTLLSELNSDFNIEENSKQVKATVASLRLDAVSSHGFSISRSQMLDEIKAGKVKLNWKESTDPAKPVKKGDIISCRGRGRVVVEEVTGTTKKGRIGVVLRRML